jgi:hypothetical protein
MIRRLAALILAAALSARAEAATCPEPSPELLFHSCWAGGRAAIMLLPEDLPVPPPPATGRRLVVTGAYTGKDSRTQGVPNPVGLFVHGGAVVNPDMARMDGVLVVAPDDHGVQLNHRAAARLEGEVYDLTDLASRRGFLASAASQGASVLQSHLVVVGGLVDVRPQEGAPLFVRRLLFTDAAGFGLFQTRTPETLHDAAALLVERLGARMALNLDMGSYDYCLSAVDGVERTCGFLAREETSKLSNLLVLTSD